jgi:hypothetical protein
VGTRSFIAKQIGDDQYLTIFCHFDGHPEDNGATLVQHYNTPEQVDALLALGDLYYLREEIAPAPGVPHEHDSAQPGVTIAYQRDEGWTGCEAKIMALEEIDDPGLDGVEFTYIFSSDGQWLYFPTGEAECGIRNVKADLDADTVQYGAFYTEFEEKLGLADDEPDELQKDITLTQIQGGMM